MSVGHDPDQAFGGPLEHYELEYYIDIDVCTYTQSRKLVSICLFVPNEQREGCGARTADEATPATPAPKVTASPIWMVNEPDVFE